MILTNGKGIPFRKPEPPPQGAPIEDVVAFIRAHGEYNQQVNAVAYQAFDKQFRRTLKLTKPMAPGEIIDV